MAFLVTIDVQCDHEGCLTWVFGGSGRRGNGAKLYAEARKRASEHGWKRQNGKDYCPDHVPAP